MKFKENIKSFIYDLQTLLIAYGLILLANLLLYLFCLIIIFFS